MKKIIFVAIVFSLVCGTASAQEKVEFSIKAGLNLSYEYGGDESSGKKPGLYAGIGVEFPLGNHGGIQPELLYSMQGGKFGGSTEYVDYINLPVIFKIYPESSRRFSIDIGPQFGYMISAKVKSSYSGINTDFYEYLDNKFDVGAAAGFSVKIGRGNPFDFSARYNLGLVNPVKGANAKNAVLQFGLGARF